MSPSNALRKYFTGLICLVAASVILVLAPTGLFAQAYFGGIVGTITDPSNAAIPGAAVTVTNTETNVSYHATTNRQGYYSVEQLIPGNYTVTGTKTGFQTLVVGPIKIDVNATVTANMTLKVGAVTQKVSVKAVAPLINTTSGTVGSVVNNRTVTQMPLNGRNFTQLIELVPGTVSTGNSRQAQGGSNYSVSGMQAMQNGYSLDGVYDNEEFFGQYSLQPIVDAIQEFKVRTNITSAEYGRAAGANIAVATKSGTNQFHGDVWEFLRNNDLDANGWFNNYYGVPRSVYRHNQFGFTAGGPVYIPKLINGKNKLFWFADYQGTRQNEASTQLGTFPTTAMFNGNFTAPGLQTIYNPATTTQVGTDANGNPIYSRTAFSGNIIPPSDISPITAAYAKAFYPGVTTLGANNYVSSRPFTLDGNQWDTRIDYNLSNSIRIFGRFSKQYITQTSPSAFPSESSNLVNDFKNGELSLTWLINPTTVLDVKTAANRSNLTSLDTNPAPGGAGFLSAYPISGVEALADLYPALGISNYSSPGQSGAPFITNMFQNIVDLTMVKGKQTMKMGFTNTHMNGLTTNWGIEGIFSFTTVPTSGFDAAGNPISTTGDPVASFLLGLPSSGIRNVGQIAIYPHENTWATYFQDNIRATRKLTLNLGVRYEYDGWPYGKYNRLGNYYFDTHSYGWSGVNPITGAPPNSPRSLMNTDWNNWAPRIGVAYALTPTTVVRSGFGIFYNGDNYWMAQSTRGQWPYGVSETFSSTNNLLPTAPLATFFGNYFTPTAGTPPNEEHVVARNNVIPETYQWSLTIQHQITQSMMLQVSYIGNRSKNDPNFINANDPPPGPGTVGTPEHPRPEQKYTPSLGAVSLITYNSVSNYNGLQAELDKRFSHGLEAIVSYAYAHALSGPGGAGFNYQGSPQNSACRYCDYSNSPYYRAHIFSASTVYYLPFGRGQRFGSNMNSILNGALGNWQFSGLWTANTGGPMNIGIPFDVANTGPRSLVMRPNYVGGAQRSNPASGNDRVGWINPSAYAIPPPYTFGNLGRYSLLGPGFFDWDAGIYKNFPINEGKQSIQFRSEFFNFPNTHNFGCINTTLTSSNFGQSGCTQQGARIIQFALKIKW